MTSGVLAFKAKRIGHPIFTTTSAIFFMGQTYTLPGAATFYYTSSSLFFTVPGTGILLPGIMATVAPAGQHLTLTRIGGTQARTIPNYCTVTTLIYTWVTSAD